MKTYVRGAASLSAQGDGASLQMLLGQDAVRAREPSYEQLGTPNALRRMARAVKMGLTVSRAALAQAGVAAPDAIVTATGFGCLEESERFLLDVAANGEQFLTPTAFSQSTHNTVASQISLALRCHGYNTTYVDRGFSFESALLDAQLLLAEGEAESVLCCAVDEFTETYAKHRRAAGHLRAWNSREDFFAGGQGAPMGEGAGAFVLSREPGSVELRAVKTLYRPERPSDALREFLDGAEVDLVLLGLSGDARHDAPLRELEGVLPASAARGAFKHLSGEFETASAFAFWLARRALETGEVPEELQLTKVTREPRTVLVANGYKGVELTLTLLAKA